MYTSHFAIKTSSTVMPFGSIEETITAFYCDKMLRNSGSLQWTID